MLPVADLVLLAEDRWRPLEHEHAAEVARLTVGHAERAAAGVKHPVEDFLFTYYSHKRSRLARWHPGPGVALAGAVPERGDWRFHRTERGAVLLDEPAFLDARGSAVRHVRSLLAATAARPPRLGCFGLHEWAMVHRVPEGAQRHEAWPLRLGAAGTDAVVEAADLQCTHIDAFRFFTPTAVPRNAFTPTRESQVAMEQPGCLHATMDLYKWAYKLSPAVPGGLLLDCFRLARDVRTLDMAASPYDLAALGVTPVQVETGAGRAEYVRAQQEFVARAAPLRTALVALCDRLLAGGSVAGAV